MNELNKNITLFNKFNKFNDEPAQKTLFNKLIVKYGHFIQHACDVTLTFNTLLTLICIAQMTSGQGFITLLHRVLCDKIIFSPQYNVHVDNG